MRLNGVAAFSADDKLKFCYSGCIGFSARMLFAIATSLAAVPDSEKHIEPFQFLIGI
jgi:hypothetical protein